MSRPSDPLLSWLRNLINERGLNTAAIATRADLPRARMRKLLAGGEPMLVDELLKISEALELSPADMGVPVDQLPDEDESEEAAPGLAVAEPDEQAGPDVDPWGNHHQQLFEIAFALGCDFGFTAKPDMLGDSGVPQAVLDQHSGRMMLIQLEAAYHNYNDPRYDESGVTITLSFDALYTCRFPWTAIHQVLFTPTPFDEAGGDPTDDGPHLRLVT